MSEKTSAQALNGRRFFAQINKNPETIVKNHCNFTIFFNFYFIYHINFNHINMVWYSFLVYFYSYFLFLGSNIDNTKFFFYLSIFFFFSSVFNFKSWVFRANQQSKTCKTNSGNVSSFIFKEYEAFFKGIR